MTEDAIDPEGPAINERILQQLDAMTSSERRLADVVLESIATLPSFTASELAARAQVSNATAARFFQRLGYKSFAEFRRQVRGRTDWGSPLYQLTGIGQRRMAPGDFGLHIAQDLQNLTRTAEMLQPELIDAAVALLARARTIWVVGFRNSYALATYARGVLIHLKPDVRLLPIAGMTMGEELVGIGPQDAVLAIGFRRRPTILREILAVARERGAPVVFVADMTATRTAQLADIVLRCQNRGQSLFDSYAAPMSLINYLCSAVGTLLGDLSVQRLTDIEKLHDRLDPMAPAGTGPRRARK